jgi:hypothetical protein
MSFVGSIRFAGAGAERDPANHDQPKDEHSRREFVSVEAVTIAVVTWANAVVAQLARSRRRRTAIMPNVRTR